MSEVLAEVLRGGMVESKHRGSVVVADLSGRVRWMVGDPYMKTFLRSAAKPLQALEVLLSGAGERFSVSDRELAIMCGSHYGEDIHRRTIESMLKKMDVSPMALGCGDGPPLSPDVRQKRIQKGQGFDSMDSCCSGKHGGMLAVCLARGYPLDNYLDPTHPVQRDLVEVIGKMCALSPQEIEMGEDGCGAPVHAMSLYHMALGFARLARPEGLGQLWRGACKRVFAAMNDAPDMLSGKGGFCTELHRHTHKKLCGKLGAEGVYCIGLRDRGLGIAIKIEDGDPTNRAVFCVALECLRQLEAISEEECRALAPFAKPVIQNALRRPVGNIVPVFTLRKV